MWLFYTLDVDMGAFIIFGSKGILVIYYIFLSKSVIFPQDWYLGGLVRNTGVRGIVPKVYLRLVDPQSVSGGAVVQESTAMLRK